MPGLVPSLVLPGPYRAVLFDMDGLLLDTEPLWVRAEAELLAGYGIVATAEDAAATHGRAIEDSVAVYRDRLGGADATAIRTRLLEIMRGHYLAAPPLRPGARELVDALRGQVPMAVASSTTGDLVRAALEGVGLLGAFDAIASGHDLGRAKPAPDVYLEACRLLGVAPADALAFEDSPAGVRSAVAAGVAVVGVPERDGVDLAGAGAALVLASLADVVVEGRSAVGS